MRSDETDNLSIVNAAIGRLQFTTIAAHHPLRVTRSSSPSSCTSALAPVVFFDNTWCVASQKARLTSGYFRPVAVAGRVTALLKTSSNSPMNGFALVTSGSL